MARGDRLLLRCGFVVLGVILCELLTALIRQKGRSFAGGGLHSPQGPLIVVELERKRD